MNKLYLRRSILEFLVLIFLITAIPLSAQKIGSGLDHSIATDPSGKVYTWGANGSGQLGNGNNTDNNEPVAVNALSGKTIISIEGYSHSMALASDGTVYTWGYNISGQLGNGNYTDSNVPVAVTALSGKTITAIAGGTGHSIALASDGTVYTWGIDLLGQLGNGNNTDSNVPVAVTALSGKSITSIAAGYGHSIAIASDGTVYTWGYNDHGQLGNGNNTDSNLPAAVTALSGKSITSIAAGYKHSIALASDGTVYTWGIDLWGQLGNGNNTDSNVPVAVTALSGKSITSIAAGYGHSIAIASDSTVYTWGLNIRGQLGNGNYTNSNVPIAVTALSAKTITSIAAGYEHSIALAKDGTVYTWGYNVFGQLGNGNNIGSNVPVAVNQSIFTWPAASAPTPTEASENVISIFSDAYTSISNVDLNPNWQQTTRVVEIPIQGNNTLVYSGLDYQGIDFDPNHQNVSGMDFVHVDFWTANSTTLNIYLISPGPVEKAYPLTVPTNGNWASVDIPLTEFSPVNLADVFQFKFEGDGDIYLDNIYFYKKVEVTPTTAAPTPTEASENVISIFSDTYTPINDVDLNPNWSQSTVVTQLSIDGNNTLVYSGLNYQGIDFDPNHQNVSAMAYVHVDYWTANSTLLNIYLISPGPVEKAYPLTVPTNGSWTSLDIPLTEFSPVDLADIFQFKFEGNGDVYLDNIYFYSNTTSTEIEEEMPKVYDLSQNYPNPFNPSTTIKIGLPEQGFADLRVYNVLGEEVAQLVSKELNAGYHEFNFDASNLSSGIYFYKIEADNFVEVKKMSLLK